MLFGSDGSIEVIDQKCLGEYCTILVNMKKYLLII